MGKLDDFYNDELTEDVFELLGKIECAGSYFSDGKFVATDAISMPTLEVKKATTFTYPITTEQIQKAIEKAERAPYGRGTETIVDTNVRKVWQLQPKAIKLTGMDKVLADILPKINLELGLGPQEKVKANLYKVLVYDKGAFFLPHKDSEKEEKMFGTLVISLPSSHKGGDLVIRHSGGEQVITMDDTSDTTAEQSSKTIKYCAFYADCEHEVREITEGNRVCLVYNLCRGGRSLFPATVNVSSIVRSKQAIPQIEQGLVKFFNSNLSSPLFVLLEHSYAPSGFSCKKLKGRDTVLVNLFNLISKNISCSVLVGILHITEEGFLGDDNARDRDIPKTLLGEPTGEYGDPQYEIHCGEISDLNCVAKPKGMSVGAVLGSLKGTKSTKKMVTKKTGNEGSTFEKLYHRACIILIPSNPYTPNVTPVTETTTTTTNTTKSTENNDGKTTTTTTTTTATPTVESTNKEEIKVDQTQPTTTTTAAPVKEKIKVEQTTTSEPTTTVTAPQQLKEETKVEETTSTAAATTVVPTTTTAPVEQIKEETKVEETTVTTTTVEQPKQEEMKVDQPTSTATEQSEGIDSEHTSKKQKLE